MAGSPAALERVLTMKLISRLKARAGVLKQELVALYYVWRNPDTPRICRALILVTLGYALSPIDLIPDFIPILGYLDDLIIVPALIALALRLVPPGVLAEARQLAVEVPLQLSRNWIAAGVIMAVWLVLAALAVKALW
jgi:uncharacterized membrane protein YkvA (DUF1232 family)